MLPKCIVLFLVIVAVKSATFQGRNIPVEVRYERFEHSVGSNLEEKIQLSEEEIKQNNLRLQKLSIAEEDLTPTNNHNFIRNFEEKVQLSPEELLQSSKHIPVSQEVQEDDVIAEKLGELRVNPQLESKAETLSKVTFIQRAQEIVEKGLENLRKNFIPTDNEISPSTEQWEQLESQVKEYFTEEKNKIDSRQTQVTEPQNIFQNIASGIQQVSNNFVQQFQGQNQNVPPAASGDEGQPQPAPAQQGPVQGFIGYFTGGVQNIVSNIQNIAQGGPQSTGNNTVLGDSGTGGSQQPGNFFGNFVNNVQQLIQGQVPGNNQGVVGNGTQGDTAGSPGSSGGVQQGIFAGAISQFNQVVSNFIPPPQPAPPATQGDEGTGGAPANQPAGPFQQVVQSFGNIGTAFNQFIQGGPQQTKPPGSEDENAGSPPANQNFVQSIGQNIGNAFQTIQNQFRPPVPAVPDLSGGNLPDVGSNPIVGQVTNVGNQIQQIAGQQAGSNPIQNLIPGSSGTASKQPAEEKPEVAPPTIEKTESSAKKSKVPKKQEEVLTATE